MSTCDANLPGKLVLRGQATFASESNSKYGVDIWCGIWEIDGGQARIRVGDIEFWGNKFKDAVNTKTQTAVGEGLSVLKLTGDGISTINARKIDFVDAVVLDLADLRVPEGTYKVIDGTAVKGANLRFAAGTDTSKWSLKFDRQAGDLMLTFSR
jgi:hypothetical protein